MAKKSTAKCTEIAKRKALPVYIYEIGHMVNDQLISNRVVATMVVPECDDLQIFAQVSGEGEEVQIGAYRDWKYFRLLEAVDNKKTPE